MTLSYDHIPEADLLPFQVEGLLEADQADARDTSNIMCQLIGDMTGFHTLAPYKKEVHAVQSGVQWDDDDSDGKPSVPDLPPSDVELLVGWANRLASARCLSTSGRDCLRRHAKVWDLVQSQSIPAFELYCLWAITSYVLYVQILTHKPLLLTSIR